MKELGRVIDVTVAISILMVIAFACAVLYYKSDNHIAQQMNKNMDILEVGVKEINALRKEIKGIEKQLSTCKNEDVCAKLKAKLIPLKKKFDKRREEHRHLLRYYSGEHARMLDVILD